VEEVKKRIVVGAAELFQKYGIRSVSMDDIARHLTMSKKTIYQYFKDKDEIVTLALRAHMEMEMKEYDEVFEHASNAVEELALVSKCMRKDFKGMNPSLLFDMQKYHPEAWGMWLKFKNEFIKDHVVDNLKRGIKEGYFRKDIDPEVMAIFRVEQVQLAFDDTVFPQDQFNFTEVQMQFFNHFVHGIVTEPGLKLFEEYLEKTLEQE